MSFNIVYYFQGQDSEELKYSIRSVEKNLDYDVIYLVGDKPSWFKETSKSVYIKSGNYNLQYYGLGSVPILHLKKLYDSGKMPDKFLLFNDDFYIMKRIKDWIEYYRLEKDYNQKALKNHGYHKKTLRSWQYTEKKKAYNLHQPMMIEKENFVELLKMWEKFQNKDIDFRTLYGNLFTKSKIGCNDCKIGKNYEYSKENLEKIKNSMFLSTSDGSFKEEKIGEIIRTTFDKPSSLEML